MSHLEYSLTKQRRGKEQKDNQPEAQPIDHQMINILVNSKFTNQYHIYQMSFLKIRTHFNFRMRKRKKEQY